MHRHQRRILDLLARHDGARFSELQRSFDLRSNTLSYHLNQLRDEGLVDKDGDKYRLSGDGKVVAPYLGRERQPLTVVLVAPVIDDTVFLVEREKEVYRGYYAIPSETVAYGEEPGETIDRLQDAYGLEFDDVTYRKTVVEIDRGDGGERKHHFVFLVYSGTPREPPADMRAFDIDAVSAADDVIPTDARIVDTLDQPGLAVLGMDLSDGLALREQ